MIDLIHSHANKRHLDPFDWNRTVQINTKGIDSTDFGLTPNNQDLLISQGYKAMTSYIDQFDNTWVSPN